MLPLGEAVGQHPEPVPAGQPLQIGCHPRWRFRGADLASEQGVRQRVRIRFRQRVVERALYRVSFQGPKALVECLLVTIEGRCGRRTPDIPHRVREQVAVLAAIVQERPIEVKADRPHRGIIRTLRSKHARSRSTGPNA